MPLTFDSPLGQQSIASVSLASIDVQAELPGAIEVTLALYNNAGTQLGVRRINLTPAEVSAVLPALRNAIFNILRNRFGPGTAT
jgi:hypothetical protein